MNNIYREIDSKRPYCIYKYTNKINNKVYIGQTKQQLDKRAAHNGNHYDKCPQFYNAIQKYGWENFIPEILEDNLTLEQANERESYWISYFNSYLDDSKGYNSSPGGDNRDFQYQSQKLKDWWARPENHQKMLEIRQEQAKKESFRKACSEGQRKKWEDPEYKEKMCKIRQTHPPKHTACICINTGEEFFTLKDAMIWAGLKSSTGILACCQGKRNYSGLHPITKEKLKWRFKKEE